MSGSPLSSSGGDGSVRIESKHAQVRRFLVDGVCSGRFPVGGSLPSEGKLMQQLGVSRVTIRHALAHLMNDGFIQSQQGLPHVVLSQEPRPMIGLIYGYQVYGPQEILSYRLM